MLSGQRVRHRLTGMVQHWAQCIVIIACCGCTAPVTLPFAPNDQASLTSIYLVSYGWHAGIVLKRADIRPDAWPAIDDFATADYLEVNWGDAAFYQAPGTPVGAALKAVLWPTPSVLHIVGFSGKVAQQYPLSQLIELRVSPQGFEHLLRHIAASFALDNTGRSQFLGPGLYGNSRFYLSRESYHLFNTCNIWTARALNAAGLPISPWASLTARGLMRQAKAAGREIRPHSSVIQGIQLFREHPLDGPIQGGRGIDDLLLEPAMGRIGVAAAVPDQ